MASFKLNPRLQGDLGEVIFEHYCRHNGKKEFAFLHIRTRDILRDFLSDNVIPFKFENKIVRVEIPDDIESEIRSVCKPSNKNYASPTFTPDFLSVPIKDFFKEVDGQLKQVKKIPSTYFNWIEVKTNDSPLSENQEGLRKKSQIGLRIFRIKADFPKTFEVTQED
jgi:hypothetical protein